jgi:hypothetical protein
MKAGTFPTPEIFLSTIFLSTLGSGTKTFWTGKSLEPDPGMLDGPVRCMLSG